MTWKEQKDGSWLAYARRHSIGFVVPIIGGPNDGKFIWQIDLQQGCSDTLDQAKGALSSAWGTWLLERGLRAVH